MTQEELDALPEHPGPIYQGEDDIMIIWDRQGRAWMTGWVNGKHVKKRLHV
jgi:hypothetical protein